MSSERTRNEELELGKDETPTQDVPMMFWIEFLLYQHPIVVLLRLRNNSCDSSSPRPLLTRAIVVEGHDC